MNQKEEKLKNKYLFYLDDSGTAENPCYLGGFIIQNGDNRDNETGLQLALKRIKKDILANENAYIKWSPTKRENPEQYGLSKDKKKLLKEKVLNLVNKYDEITIISAIIKKDKDYWSSQAEALRRLSERFVYFISSREGFNRTKQGYYPYGQIIIDYLGPRKKKNNLTKVYHDYWVNGNIYSADLYDFFIEKERWRKVELNHCLRETIFFSQSKYCDLLQIADFITGSIRELIKKSNNVFYNLIKNKIRRDRYGNLNGYGLIFIPKEMGDEYRAII